MLTVVQQIRRVAPMWFRAIGKPPWETGTFFGGHAGTLHQAATVLEYRGNKLHTVRSDARWVTLCNLGTLVESPWLARESYLVF